jgi:hypothetical protein
MGQWNKGIYTRIDDRDYAILERLAGELRTSVYELAREAIYQMCRRNEYDPEATVVSRNRLTNGGDHE